MGRSSNPSAGSARAGDTDGSRVAPGSTRLIIVAGVTRTAEICGISAAGVDPDAMVHTPSADVEIVEYGRPVRAPVVPVSPTGCPTPAVVTRAARERLGFETTVVDAGLATATAAPTVTVGAGPGDDVREPDPVPFASDVFATARELGRALPDDDLLIGETIPGGTTTALGVLTALGESATVSSSLPENPLALKREVVTEALAASDLRAGAVCDPLVAARRVGDPVLVTVAGLAVGAIESGKTVTLAGGTQMVAAGALVRRSGVDAPLSVATTSFVAGDETANVREATAGLDLELTVTDPGFDGSGHVAMERYARGEAKEGVGMGGALALADRADVPMAAIRERIAGVYDRLEPGDRPRAEPGAGGKP